MTWRFFSWAGMAAQAAVDEEGAQDLGLEGRPRLPVRTGQLGAAASAPG